nr:retrovirus-related Pol polyprotein from transposon TNT 1-94 [Tanacetum cinerariifolium]
MASEQSSLEPALHEMTAATPSSGLVPNPYPLTPFVPPSRHEWDLVFQPLFDEFFSPPASVASSVPIKEAPTPVESTGLPSSITCDQDASSLSTSQTTSQLQSQKIPLCSEEESHDLEDLVPRPDKVMVITLKWIHKVKLDELGGILKNKARLLARGYLQEQGINFEESFTPMARIEFVRIFLAFAAYMNMIVYHMDVKTAKTQLIPHCSSAEKAKISSWYKLLDTPMVEKSKLDEDTQGKVVDPTHYRGMVGTLTYLTSSRPNLVYAVRLWYSKDSTIDLTAFADADHAGCQDTRRSIPGSMQLLGDKLGSWSLKRQKSTTISSTEAKYIALMKSFTSETLKELADEAEE